MLKSVKKLRPKNLDYMKARPYETAISFVFIVSALVYFTGGDTSSPVLAHALGDLKWIMVLWNIMWGLGGLFMFSGLAYPDSKFRSRYVEIDGIALELCGVIFATVALLIYLIAIVAIVGLSPATSTLLALVLAGAYRAWAITARPQRVTLYAVPGGPGVREIARQLTRDKKEEEEQENNGGN
jgi:hypothetical protein